MAARRFHLSIASRTLVRASRPQPGFPAVLAVSNLDLILGPFPIFLVSVYPAPAAGLDAVLAAVRGAFPAYLSSFFPFAGRIVRDPETKIPEVQCNNAGAELVVADAAVPLADVDFTEVDRSLGLIQIPFDASIPMSLQLVRFACGGFALTVGTTHLLADGRAFTILLSALAEMVRDGGLSREPLFDRSLFKPRSPPWYSASLDVEFARFTPETMINPVLTAAIRRRLYRIEARFQELADWMEERKAAFRDGGKWTEEVNLGLGSPALVISGLLPFPIDGDLGFGKPRLVMPWLRHGRLGSANVTVVPSPSGDGSWFFAATRMWPRLVEVVESDPLLKPAANLGQATPAGPRL